MIEVKFYLIGFLIYIFFNFLTFNFYSKKEEITKKYILIFIYIYYGILASYIIYLVDFSPLKDNFFEIVIQSLVYLIACAIFLFSYYKNIILKNDEKYF